MLTLCSPLQDGWIEKKTGKWDPAAGNWENPRLVRDHVWCMKSLTCLLPPKKLDKAADFYKIFCLSFHNVIDQEK